MIVNKDISVEMLVTDSLSFRNLAGIQRVVKCENVIDIQKSLSLCIRNKHCLAIFYDLFYSLFKKTVKCIKTVGEENDKNTCVLLDVKIVKDHIF